MKELITYIAENLVDDRDAIRVNEYHQRRMMVYELTVAKDETGRVIGREGKIANAMRTLLRVAGDRQDVRAVLEIN